MNSPARVFTLAKRAPEALGLVCDGDGLMLGPAPLVVPAQDAADRPIFRAARPEWLADVLAVAYGNRFDAALARRLVQLDGIAKALGDGQLAEAAIRAVHLRLPELTAEGASRLALLRKYSPDQPRVPAGEPGGGQWTSAGGRDASRVQVAANDTGVVSDAGGYLPPQVAGAGSEEESDRGGRGMIEDEFLDPIGPVRAQMFNAAITRLRAIDPANSRASYAAPPGWVPKPEDVRDAQEALESAIQGIAAKIAEHSYDEHVVARQEFSDVGSPVELQLLVQNVIRNNPPEQIAFGRTIFYETKTNTLVIINPAADSTVMRPTDRDAYVKRLRAEK